MLELGLIGEVRRLRERFDLNASLPSMRAVGYRQVWQYLEGEFGLAALREKGVAATRQLAKRQLTWLRSWQDVNRFDCLADDLAEQVERTCSRLSPSPELRLGDLGALQAGESRSPMPFPVLRMLRGSSRRFSSAGGESAPPWRSAHPGATSRRSRRWRRSSGRRP